MKKILSLLCAMVATILQGQILTVSDKSSAEHIPGVIIQSKNKGFVSTNQKGRADISAFAGEDSIRVQYTNYKTIYTSYQQLQAMGMKIKLEPTDISLSEVTVSSNHWEDEKIETPNRVEKISMKEVAFQNPQTTADLLGISGYAFIQKSQLGGGSPMLRGMATNRVLLVVDGVRMNNAIFRAGNLQNVISLDANALEGTEIIFGPGAVMYGSDAVGGVMSFHTLDTRLNDSTSKKMFLKGNALMRTSSANSEKTAHLDFNVGFRKWAFVTSFTRSDYGDLRSGSQGGVQDFYRPYYVQTIDDKDYMVKNNDSTLQVGSKYSQNNFLQKVQFSPNKYLELDYAFHYSETSPYNRYDRLYVMQTAGPYKNKLRWAEWYYGPQKWNMNRFGLTLSKRNAAYDHLRVIVALQNFEESRYDREFMVRELRMQKETVKATSLNLDLDKKIGPKMSVNYGGEIVHNLVGSYASLTHVVTDQVDSTVTRYPNGSTWESYGAYASAKYQLHKKLSVTIGGRYSFYRIKADFDTSFFPFPFTSANMSNRTLNGSLGFLYVPALSWQVYLNGGTGFRAPNIDDMGKVFESTPGYLVVPNPSLKPERVYNLELGTAKTFGNLFKFDCAMYHTWLKDGMERKDYVFNGRNTIRFQGNSSKIQALQNVSKIRVYGVQAGFEFNFRGLGLKSTFSYQKGEEQTVDSLKWYPLRHAAPMFGSVHFTYQIKKFKFDFYTLYNSKMDYEDLSLTERQNLSYARDYTVVKTGLPYVAGWHTLNFKAAFYANKNVGIMAGIENIADLMYRPYSSGINAPGRNFIVSLNAKF